MLELAHPPRRTRREACPAITTFPPSICLPPWGSSRPKARETHGRSGRNRRLYQESHSAEVTPARCYRRLYRRMSSWSSPLAVALAAVAVRAFLSQRSEELSSVAVAGAGCAFLERRLAQSQSQFALCLRSAAQSSAQSQPWFALFLRCAARWLARSQSQSQSQSQVVLFLLGAAQGSAQSQSQS